MATIKHARPLYLLLGIALVALALWGFWPRATPVESAAVTRGPLSVTFTEEGRTRLRDRYLLSAPLDGTVERIVLEPGDPVAAGAQVAVLRPANAALLDPAARSEAEARWRSAQKDLNAATASATAAEALSARLAAARRRAESLAATQLLASDQLEEVRAQWEAAAANLEAARARSEAARVHRDNAKAVLELQGAPSRPQGHRLPLSSPIEGRVIRRFVESEGFVRASQPLLELGDPRALEVVVEALTTDAVRVSPGARVRLLRWGGDTPLSGRIQAIEPGGFTKFSALGVEEQRVLIVIALDDPAAAPTLGDGFRVEAEFEVWHADSVLSVPVSALFRDGEQWAVYAIERGRARLRPVQLGAIGEQAAELRGGLKEGAAVVLYPGDRLRDGMRVAARTTPDARKAASP